MKKDRKALVAFYIIFISVAVTAFFFISYEIEIRKLTEEIEYLNRDIINLRDDNWNLHDQLNNTKKPS